MTNYQYRQQIGTEMAAAIERMKNIAAIAKFYNADTIVATATDLANGMKLYYDHLGLGSSAVQ